jgi:uncharacterized repeat protein (TIGR03847 family)
VQFIRPEAIGEPGARRFRIVVVINGRTVVSWMEKEQVRRLGELLIDVLQRLPGSTPVAPDMPETVIPDEGTQDQFRAGRMELSYDSEDDRLIIIIHDLEADEDAAPALSFRLTRQQAVQFSEQADELMSAGRPACPMCGRPMGPGPHVCEKQNGHLPH